MFLLANSPPEEIKGAEDVGSLELNTRISISGQVVAERIIYEGTKILELDNGIIILCECNENFKDREIKVVGRVSDYDGKRQIVAEEVSLSDF